MCKDERADGVQLVQWRHTVHHCLGEELAKVPAPGELRLHAPHVAVSVAELGPAPVAGLEQGQEPRVVVPRELASLALRKLPQRWATLLEVLRAGLHNEELKGVDMAAPHRVVEAGLLLAVAEVHPRSSAHEQLQGLDLAAPCCEHRWRCTQSVLRPAVHVQRLPTAPRVQQLLDSVDAPPEHGGVQVVARPADHRRAPQSTVGGRSNEEQALLPPEALVSACGAAPLQPQLERNDA
mmetsp:Transcript_41342/g.131501  ORF Transcript_41342/g.131501 Transcript_41342/m.131501 type:complete len:237 (-) Transcript_41342:1118-1828(-)